MAIGILFFLLKKFQEEDKKILYHRKFITGIKANIPGESTYNFAQSQNSHTYPSVGLTKKDYIRDSGMQNDYGGTFGAPNKHMENPKSAILKNPSQFTGGKRGSANYLDFCQNHDFFSSY